MDYYIWGRRDGRRVEGVAEFHISVLVRIGERDREGGTEVVEDCDGAGQSRTLIRREEATTIGDNSCFLQTTRRQTLCVGDSCGWGRHAARISLLVGEESWSGVRSRVPEVHAGTSVPSSRKLVRER